MFKDDQPKWYVAVGDNWIGPMKASELHDRLLKQDFTWAHFVWKKGQDKWKRVCDVKPFSDLVPKSPSKKAISEIKKEVPEVKKTDRNLIREWFLYFNDNQYGPYSAEEIQRYLQAGRVHGRVHGWKEGMNGWARLNEIKNFKEHCEPASKKIQEESLAAQEQRTSPRKPLYAKIMLTDHKELVTGLCRDISIGGMQVLSDAVPGEVGAVVRLNVSSSGEAGSSISPFVAQGEIVRILEDGRGFSFRFKDLSPEAQQIIDDYLATE